MYPSASRPSSQKGKCLMPRKKRPPTSPQYQEALDTVLELGFYVLQRRVTMTGCWVTATGEIRGRKAALALLNDRKEGDPAHEWRAVQTIQAEAYAEGWKAHDDFITGRYECPSSSTESSAGRSTAGSTQERA